MNTVTCCVEGILAFIYDFSLHYILLNIHQKMFQIEVIGLNETYILCHVPFFGTMSLSEKMNKDGAIVC